MLAHELERGAAGSDPAAVERQQIPVPSATRCVGAGDDGEEITPDATATGHDDRCDERGRDRGVDRIAARRQYTQPGRRDERMLRTDDAAPRHDGADPA